MSPLNPSAPNALRIVSLLPSATEILAVLNLTPAIVGRSHECDYPPEIASRPICTSARLNPGKPSGDIDADVKTLLQSTLSIYDIELDVLQHLQPTHIVTQDQCDVCAVNFSLVEAAVATLSEPRPKVISLQPHTLSDVWTDIERVATELQVDSSAAIAPLKARVDACRQKTQDLSNRPTVAAIEWIDPLMGSGNWIPELVELAGGKDLFGTVGQHSPYISWDALLVADPDVIIVMPCGFDLAKTRQEMQQAIATHPQWQQLRAVQQQQLYLTDGNAYFNRPGPRLVDSLEILAEILHPDLFQPHHNGSGWQPFVE
ncbi:cobalamin-binding protein [Oscillatoria sp. FACHB-1407]|uniref:cobalamin-binding protein n=1 Tax=Oscillatoria sp. FACHB-1407 TaxID=2692847 RepID=UPI00168388AC|nr:cobalamin-binding protein [Oscillatoria sp. FACHB-1407]MBD2464853.1 cobalamin-binding protein [Oscillatoria sp. FACHB-1407]